MSDMSPLTIRQIPSMVSLAQYLDVVDDELPRIQVEDWEKLTPERKVSSLVGSFIPKVGFASTPAVFLKQVKSFADFAAATTPEHESEETQTTGVLTPSTLSSRSGYESDGATGEVSLEGLSLAKSYLDAVIMHGWEERADLLRYSMDSIETRVLRGGPLPWVVQLNEGRFSKKRATEVRVDVVRQPFDDSKFNFTKALQREVLFKFERSATGESEFHTASRVREGWSPSLVLVNVSPIEYAHVLLCPNVLDRVPQLVDESNLTLALHLADEANNEHLRVGYNSLGAYGTINHMHYQAYYMQHPYPVELCATTPLGKTPEGVHLHRVEGFPTRVLAFEVENCLEALAQAVTRTCQALAEANVPHNLMVCDKGHRIFLYPNIFSQRIAQGLVPQEVVDTQVAPAVFEISGHMLMKTRETYEDMTDALCCRILQETSVCSMLFQAITNVAMGISSTLPVGPCACFHCCRPRSPDWWAAKAL